MFKKILSLIFLIGAISILSCGCVYNETTATVNPDGSGKVKAEIGFSKQIIDKVGNPPSEYFGKNTEYHSINYGGTQYLVSTFEDAFLGTYDMNWTSVGTVTNEMGPISLDMLDDGSFKLNVKLNDEFSANMTTANTLPSLDKISDSALQGMTLIDLIAQNAEGLHLKLTFNLPYPVEQVNGLNEGITVSGKTVSLDYMKMIKSDCHEWTFNSIKTTQQIIYNDVNSNAWYYAAVNFSSNRNLMNGYNGSFNPNNQLTRAELCKIVAKIGGENLQNDPEYWAKNYIEYCKYMEFVLSNDSITKENWNVPATREEAVYAITLATSKMDRINSTNSSDITDFNSINSNMKEIILLAYDLGIVNGSNDGTFSPKDSVTRAEICQILYNIQ